MVKMKNKTFIYILLWALLALSATGCEKNNTPEEYVLKSIHVNKSSLSLKVGARDQLTASAVPSVAHSPAFQWTSANNAIATVVNGLVEAIGAGETSVTVNYQDISMTIPVKVEAADAISKGVLYDKILKQQ